MQITLNGKPRHTSAATVGALLRELGWEPVGLAVAVNETVVRKAALDAHALNEADRVEIIRAVQGG